MVLAFTNWALEIDVQSLGLVSSPVVPIKGCSSEKQDSQSRLRIIELMVKVEGSGFATGATETTSMRWTPHLLDGFR